MYACSQEESSFQAAFREMPERNVCGWSISKGRKMNGEKGCGETEEASVSFTTLFLMVEDDDSL